MSAAPPTRRMILATSSPTSSGGIHVLAYRGQELAGHAVATTRWLQPDGLPLLRTAYVDAVATLPAYQGQGIGSALMRHLATAIADFEIGCLETDRVSFYARVGWELWRGPLAGRRATVLLPTPDQQGIVILRLARTPPLDLDGLAGDRRGWADLVSELGPMIRDRLAQATPQLSRSYS